MTKFFNNTNIVQQHSNYLFKILIKSTLNQILFGCEHDVYFVHVTLKFPKKTAVKLGIRLYFSIDYHIDY